MGRGKWEQGKASTRRRARRRGQPLEGLSPLGIRTRPISSLLRIAPCRGCIILASTTRCLDTVPRKTKAGAETCRFLEAVPVHLQPSPSPHFHPQATEARPKSTSPFSLPPLSPALPHIGPSSSPRLAGLGFKAGGAAGSTKTRFRRRDGQIATVAIAKVIGECGGWQGRRTGEAWP